MRGQLHKYFLNNGHKRIDKWAHYFDVYERHMSRFCGTAVVMVEIGVMGGGSLAMWRDYFGNDAKIIGIDIKQECKQHEADGIEVFIGSQDDPKVIDSIFKKYGHVDIVLDDGSHRQAHMIDSFNLFYHRLSKNGLYIVEDCHACYLKKYGGGLKNKNTFIEFAKDKVDNLNAYFIKDGLAVNDFTTGTDSINFYDSMVVFERRPQSKRFAPKTMPMIEAINARP